MVLIRPITPLFKDHNWFSLQIKTIFSLITLLFISFFEYFTITGKNHWSGYDAWWDSWFKRIVTKDHMEVWFSKRNKWEKLRAQRWYWNVSIDILHWFCICFLYHLLQLSLKNDVLKCSAHHSKFCVVKNQYLKCVILKDTKNWLISKILHLSLFV